MSVSSGVENAKKERAPPTIFNVVAKSVTGVPRERRRRAAPGDQLRQHDQRVVRQRADQASADVRAAVVVAP